MTETPEASPVALLAHAVDEIARRTKDRAPIGVHHDDADDTSGSWETDDAIGFDPFPVLRAIDAHGGLVVVMGQVAGIMHGSVELTGDLDLLWDGDERKAHTMATAFASAGAQVADQEDRAVPCDEAAFLLPKVLFRTTSASGDCCTPLLPWGALDIRAIISRADIAIGADGLTVRYVALRDLITMRRAAGRPKDLRRAAELDAR